MFLYTPKIIFYFIGIVVLLFNCSSERHTKMNIEKQAFGTTPDGIAVDIYTLRNTNGLEAKKLVSTVKKRTLTQTTSFERNQL